MHASEAVHDDTASLNALPHDFVDFQHFCEDGAFLQTEQLVDGHTIDLLHLHCGNV